MKTITKEKGKETLTELMKGFIVAFLILLISIPAISKIRANQGTIPEGCTTTLVTISEGDRAWNIQQKLTPDANVSDILSLVSTINNKPLGKLEVGEELVFIKESK